MKNSKISMTVIADEWLCRKRMTIKQSTYVKYKRIIRLQLQPFFLSQKMSEDAIVHFFMDIYQSHKYALSTIQTIRYVLRSVLSFAENKYDIAHIDFQYVKMPRQHTHFQILSDQQESQLRQYCFYKQDALSLAILFGLYAGLRIGEICALQWQDIDLEQGVIYISKTAQRIENEEQSNRKTVLMVTTPKTPSSKRLVPVPEFIKMHLIRNYGNHYNELTKKHYILSDSNLPIDPRTIQYQFQRLCRQKEFQINFHALRHTYATRCIEVGIDVKSLSEMLGHSSLSITLGRYVHSSLAFKKEQINKIKHPFLS